LLVPGGGVGWITGDHDVAPPGSSECVLTLGVGTSASVDELMERAQAATDAIVKPAGRQPRGYAGAFAIPDGRHRNGQGWRAGRSIPPVHPGRGWSAHTRTFRADSPMPAVAGSVGL